MFRKPPKIRWDNKKVGDRCPHYPDCDGIVQITEPGRPDTAHMKFCSYNPKEHRWGIYYDEWYKLRQDALDRGVA